MHGHRKKICPCKHKPSLYILHGYTPACVLNCTMGAKPAAELANIFLELVNTTAIPWARGGTSHQLLTHQLINRAGHGCTHFFSARECVKEVTVSYSSRRHLYKIQRAQLKHMCRDDFTPKAMQIWRWIRSHNAAPRNCDLKPRCMFSRAMDPSSTGRTSRSIVYEQPRNCHVPDPI